jgi:hypothetical protein
MLKRNTLILVSRVSCLVSEECCAFFYYSAAVLLALAHCV